MIAEPVVQIGGSFGGILMAGPLDSLLAATIAWAQVVCYIKSAQCGPNELAQTIESYWLNNS